MQDQVTQWIAAGGVLGLMAINITFVMRLMTQYRRDSTSRQEEIQLLKVQNWICDQRVNLLIFTLQHNGIEVPAAVWSTFGFNERLREYEKGQ